MGEFTRDHLREQLEHPFTQMATLYKDQSPTFWFVRLERLPRSATYQREPRCGPWEAVTSALGIESFRFHDLRHTWASWHVMSGTSLQELMELGGWKSYEMVLRYAHLAPEHLSTAAQRIERDWEVADGNATISLRQKACRLTLARKPLCPFGQKGNSSFRR